MEINQIGRSIPRRDAREKVTGQAVFPGDLSFPGMKYGKVLFSGRPHAKILEIDISRAEAAPGVTAVLTGKDVPNNQYGIIQKDQPVLCEDRVLFEGDPVALVVADTAREASRARAMISVEYEDLPLLDSVEAALEEGAPILHPNLGSNILDDYRVVKGDVEGGFKRADLICEDTYSLGGQEHAYLQPDAGLAYLKEDGTIVVKTAGQWAHDDQHQIAHSLNLPEDHVQVIYTYIGGAFGGREDISCQILLALAALKTGKPVKLTLTRKETTLAHHKRHPMRIRHKWGMSRKGQILAQEIDILADAGAYTSTSESVVLSTVLLATGPYEVPHVRLRARPVFTNHIPSGAFRGFGVAQAVLAAETHLAKMAKKLGLDPVQVRLENMLKPGSLTHSMASVRPRVSNRKTLAAAAEKAGWTRDENGRWRAPVGTMDSNSRIKRGLGIAAAWKNIGYTLGYPEQATAVVELKGQDEIEGAIVKLAAAEVGQGIHTTIWQMAADVLGLELEKVQMEYTDTLNVPSAGSVSASRMVVMAGQALQKAAEAACEDWRLGNRPASAETTYYAPPTEALDPITGQGEGAFMYAYSANAVEVEVDLDTGVVEVNRIVASHDVGQAINPQIVQGQIEGGAVQGLGWATMENFIIEQGRAQTSTFSTYLIPTSKDIPEELDVVLLEENHPLGPWGATGIGEMPLLAVAPAILDAVHDAVGVWPDGIPLTPEKMLEALDRGKGDFDA